jgi:hypothetical protein
MEARLLETLLMAFLMLVRADCALTAVIELVNTDAKLMNNKEQTMTVTILVTANPLPRP